MRRLFKLLLVLLVLVHVIPAIAITAIVLHDPPRRVAQAQDACPVGPARPASVDARRSPRTIGPGTAALMAMHMFLVFGAGTWLIGRALSSCDRSWPQPGGGAGSSGSLDYLQERTRSPGDFVVLDHAVEDLQPLRVRDLQVAVAEALEQDPELEHKVVAGRWILRRPRIQAS